MEDRSQLHQLFITSNLASLDRKCLLSQNLCVTKLKRAACYKDENTKYTKSWCSSRWGRWRLMWWRDKKKGERKVITSCLTKMSPRFHLVQTFKSHSVSLTHLKSYSFFLYKTSQFSVNFCTFCASLSNVTTMCLWLCCLRAIYLRLCACVWEWSCYLLMCARPSERLSNLRCMPLPEAFKNH